MPKAAKRPGLTQALGRYRLITLFREIIMAQIQKSTLSGYLLIAAGIVFFATALNGGQNALIAIGVVFLILGIGALRRSGAASDNSSGPAA